MKFAKVRVEFASQPPVYKCEVCGGTKRINPPKEVHELEKDLDEFERKHLNCGGDHERL